MPLRSFRTTLCIQFVPEKVAYAALYLANELNKQMGSGTGVEELISITSGGKDFAQYFQISMKELKGEGHAHVCHTLMLSPMLIIAIMIMMIKGHSLQRACLQPATKHANSKPRPPTSNARRKGKLEI